MNMKFLQISWKTTVLDSSRPDKAGVPLALSHSRREWGPPVLQHRCNTQPAAAPAALQSWDGTQLRTREGQKDTWRGHCTGRGDRNSVLCQFHHQEQFLYQTNHVSNTLQGGWENHLENAEKSWVNTGLQWHRRCCFPRGPGWGRTGKHWGNEEQESRVKSKDIKQESEDKGVMNGE